MTDHVTTTSERQPEAGHPPESQPPDAAAGGPAAVGPPVSECGEDGGGDTSQGAAELEAEQDHYLRLLRRVQAEFEKYRKRIQRDHGEEAVRAAAEALGRLLPVLDAVDTAAEHHRDVVGPLQTALHSATEQLGLERFDPAGEAFDPDVHEAVEREPGDGSEPDGLLVTRVLRPGYRLKGRLLRPAMVAVTG